MRDLFITSPDIPNSCILHEVLTFNELLDFEDNVTLIERNFSPLAVLLLQSSST